MQSDLARKKATPPKRQRGERVARHLVERYLGLMHVSYDVIGVNYAALRRPDPRIAAQLRGALGSARSVVNVGAGTGSYEPDERSLVAVEPSREMIRQRSSAAPVVRSMAERLPFSTGSFDAAMAVLTVHHWSDRERGLRELRRVAREKVVLLTFDPAARGMWLTDYFPELIALDEAQMPPLETYERALGPVTIEPVPIAHDCHDGFLYAWWRRPSAYLDERLRSGSSSFWKLRGLEAGLARLSADLASGEWNRRYAALLEREAIDLGYRLISTR